MHTCACDQGQVHANLHVIDSRYGLSPDVVPDDLPQSQLSSQTWSEVALYILLYIRIFGLPCATVF